MCFLFDDQYFYNIFSGYMNHQAIYYAMNSMHTRKNDFIFGTSHYFHFDNTQTYQNYNEYLKSIMSLGNVIA